MKIPQKDPLAMLFCFLQGCPKWLFRLDDANACKKLSDLRFSAEASVSHWLTVLPWKEHGFTLNKTGFHDTITLQYGWNPARIPQFCICGTKFSIQHAFSCSNFDIMRFVT